MLKIQVLGNGLIPRGYGLAPRKEPFFADLTLISTILSTPGLTVNMINPMSGAMIKLTPSNCKTMYDRYREDVCANRSDTKDTTPEPPKEADKDPKGENKDIHYLNNNASTVYTQPSKSNKNTSDTKDNQQSTVTPDTKDTTPEPPKEADKDPKKK